MSDNLELPAWIDEGAALRTIAAKLSLHLSGPTPNALTVLSKAVVDGEVRAREKRGTLSVVLSAADWAHRTQDGVLYLRGEEINREDLRRFLDQSDKKQPDGMKRGPTFKYDWEACVTFMGVYVYVNGFPETQSELAAIVEQWFTDTAGEAPSMSLINERVSRLFRERVRQESTN